MGSLENIVHDLMGVQPINSQAIGSSFSPTGFELNFGSLGSFGVSLS
ncbi:hypothetical protein [Rhodococcus sp. NPDC003348]